MPANVYECLFILDPNRYARDPQGVSGSIPEMVEKLDGEILAHRLWNEQKLAYPIRGHRKGTYWLTYFRLESGRIGEFNRACQLNDNVLRNLTLKVETRLADALVSHAQGKPQRAEPGEGPGGKGKGKEEESKQAESKDAKSKDAESKDAESKDAESKESKESKEKVESAES